MLWSHLKNGGYTTLIFAYTHLRVSHISWFNLDTLCTGLISPVKSMGDQCGSCSAFASIAAVETCFKRITGRFEKYSEQQLLDCGYGWNNAKGCKGAPAHAYLDWLGNNHSSVALDKDYPYESKVASCRDTGLPKNNKNKVVPVVSSSYYVNDGTEDNLKKMVYKHGAVVASIRFTNATAEKLINYHGKNFGNAWNRTRYFFFCGHKKT